MVEQPESKGHKQTKRQDVSSLRDFLTHAYGRKGRRVSLTPKMVRALALDRATVEELGQEISQLSRTDPLLSVPPQILVAVDRAGTPSILREKLVRLAVLALVSHPVNGQSDDPQALFAAILDEHDESAAGSETATSSRRPIHEGLDEVLWTVQRQALHRPAEAFGRRTISAADREQMKANATMVVLLALAIRDDWSADTLAVELEDRLWRAALESSDARARRALLTEPSLAAMGLLAKLLRGRLDEQERELRAVTEEVRATAAERDEMLEREAVLESEKRTVDQRLEMREGELRAARAELASERERLRVERSHAIDIYETLRTQTVRGLSRQVALLEDGLSALRSGSVHVAEEFMERAIEALRLELERLRQNDPADPEEPK